MAAPQESQSKFVTVASKKIAPDGDRNAYYYGIRGFPRGEPIPPRFRYPTSLLNSNSTVTGSMYDAENFTRIVNTPYRMKIFGQ